MKRVNPSRLCFSLALLACAQTGHAAIHCVDTTAELLTALNISGTNGEDDTIRIKAGTYAASSGTSAFSYASAQNFDLAIEGGWESFLQFDCFRRIDDPSNTVLTGSSVRRVFRMVPNSGTSGEWSIENLTFRDGVNVSESGGGLLIGSSLAAHNIRIERVFFYDNEAQSFGGGVAIATDGTVTLRNNLFFANQSGSNGGAAHVQTFHTNSTSVRTFIGNNTVVANTCSAGAGSCTTGGIEVFGSARATVYNNAFFANEDDDVKLAGASADLFFNNLEQFGGTPLNMAGNINVDPLFEDVLGLDFRLRFASPLRDAGTGAFALGPVDFNGLPRINGNAVDMGAFENDEIVFRNSFEPPAQ